MRYLIEVYELKSSPSSVFIDDVILEGEKEDLTIKMRNIDFVKSLGIHESFYIEKFKLVLEDEVDFPEH